MTRHIVILGFADAQVLDITGPLQTFASANDEAGVPFPYRLTVASRDGGAVVMSCGLPLLTAALSELDGQAIDTLLVSGGVGVMAAAADPVLRDWVWGRAPGVRRLGSVCSGAFLLAAAGLLDGRRATTHWRCCAPLAERYPAVRVEMDPIYVRDGDVWTSAGVTAGIDMSLALVEEDLGRDAAMRVARRLVVFLKRPGGQAQFSATLAAQTADGNRFDRLHAWMADRLHEDLSVERLAERAGMSTRNFARVYAAVTGRTPARMVEILRVEAARRALEDGGERVETIARRCGFGDPERLRRAFVRHLGVAPRAYRACFSSTPDPVP